MAEEHNAIQYASDLLRGIPRLFGLGGQDAGVGRVSESLTIVSDLWQRPDAAFLTGRKLLGTWVEQAAVALNQEAVYIINPAGSRIIATIEGVTCSATAGADIGVIAVSAAEVVGAVILGKGVNRDTRWARGTGEFTGILDVASNDLPAPSAASMFALCGGNRIFVPLNAVLTPGHALAVVDRTVGAAFTAAIQYVERQALPGELPT